MGKPSSVQDSRTTYHLTKAGRDTFSRYRERLRRIVAATAPGGRLEPS